MSFNDLITLFRQGKANAKSHIKNLIDIAAVDGNLEQVEFDLLKDLAKRNGLSQRHISEIRRSPNAVTFKVPQDSRERFSQLYELVRMMTIDKSVHEEEQRLCNLFAVKLGYKREMAHELIFAIQANISYGRDLDETMARCKLLIA